MVEKGLNKGAVFEEDGSHYMVDEVFPSGNYISHRITDAEYEKMQKAVGAELEMAGMRIKEAPEKKKVATKSASRKTASARKTAGK